LVKLEKSVYDWQVKVYDTQLQITEEEERLQKFRLQVVLNAIKGKGLTLNKSISASKITINITWLHIEGVLAYFTHLNALELM
jgi:hypothetical protein